MARYRKLVAGVVGVLAFAGNQFWGWEADEALIEQTVNGVIAVLALIGVERMRNDP